jgi:hypothetical protein
VGDAQLAALGMVGAEEHAAERVGVHMALEPHGRPALHVEDHAVPVVGSRHDGFVPRPVNQVEEVPVVKLVQPWQLQSYLVGVNTATRDGPDG